MYFYSDLALTGGLIVTSYKLIILSLGAFELRLLWNRAVLPAGFLSVFECVSHDMDWL